MGAHYTMNSDAIRIVLLREKRPPSPNDGGQRWDKHGSTSKQYVLSQNGAISGRSTSERPYPNFHPQTYGVALTLSVFRVPSPVANKGSRIVGLLDPIIVQNEIETDGPLSACAGFETLL